MSFTPETLLRHWQTLRLIPRYPRKVTAGDVCQQLGAEGFRVGKRTVERDLQALSRIFPLVVDDRAKPFGWSWEKDAPAFDLPGINSSESLTLLMARDYLRSVMPSSLQAQLAPYFRQAEQKLNALVEHSPLASWRDKVRIIPASQPLLAPRINEVVHASLLEALLLERQCSITYQSREADSPDQYPIHPLGLVQRGSVLYLVCTIKTYTQPRILALHRIKAADVMDAPIRRVEGFDLETYLSQGAMGWGGGGSLCVELIFSQEVGRHLQETPLSAEQEIAEIEGGLLRVRATVPDNQQLRWWLLGFGDGVEVISPLELRNEIYSRLHRAATRYVAIDRQDELACAEQ